MFFILDSNDRIVRGVSKNGTLSTSGGLHLVGLLPGLKGYETSKEAESWLKRNSRKCPTLKTCRVVETVEASNEDNS